MIIRMQKRLNEEPDRFLAFFSVVASIQILPHFQYFAKVYQNNVLCKLKDYEQICP